MKCYSVGKCGAWRACILPVWALSAACAAAPVLEMHVVHRPPFLVVGPHQQFSGSLVEPTLMALDKAQIAVKWREVPALRQLVMLRENSEKFCSVGWYKTPEREKIAKFSNPVYQDGPWVAVVTSRFPATAATVSEVLSDTKLKVLVKDGFVYGRYLDEKFSAMRATRMVSVGDMPQLFRMMEAGRADILFVPREEAEYYLVQGRLRAGALRILTFPEMPHGYFRYLMCSRQVDDSVLARFNAALATRF